MRITPKIRTALPRVIECHNAGKSPKQIAQDVGLSVSAIYRVLNNLPRFVAQLLKEQS